MCYAHRGPQILTSADSSFYSRPNTQKAWGSGTNPIPSRASPAGAVLQNGNASQTRPAGNMRSISQKDAGTTDRHAHDRLIFVFGAAVVCRPGYDGIILILNDDAGLERCNYSNIRRKV
jgi:hypothetical protein